jgi:hypothetical protein
MPLIIDIQSTSVYATFPAKSVFYTPMYLYNLQRLSFPLSPLTYGATPSPSTVPGGPQCYGWSGPGCSGTYKRDAIPEPTASPDVPIENRDVPLCAPSTTVTKTVSTYIYTSVVSVCNFFPKSFSDSY